MSPSFLCGVMDDTEKSVGRYNVAERRTLLGLTFVASLLDEHLAYAAVAHAYDAQAAVSSVAPLSFEVIDGANGGFFVGSCFLYAVRRNWQYFPETTPWRCRFIGFQ